MRTEALKSVARTGTVELMRYVLQRIPLASISKRQACWLLPEAAMGPGRAAMLVFLLDRGLDPNALAYARPCAAGQRNPVALHNAVQYGDDKMVKLLLDRGAKLIWDVNGKTVMAMAEDRAKKARSSQHPPGGKNVRLLEKWLKERGFPRDHADEPTLVEEEEEWELAAAEREKEEEVLQKPGREKGVEDSELESLDEDDLRAGESCSGKAKKRWLIWKTRE
ncbi:hypothetical protein B0T25DRAFT_526363 [Lasiosphaeria hispida]|uniref:Ankyrin n=1 Tax=Lasiosphaeria hispida TaxID=260671 RepID=A0AAJ0HUP2_9PEZI|nr:hypothetical protein B0T25DRAFT_526363 [Lasiosphaeria hispida]